MLLKDFGAPGHSINSINISGSRSRCLMLSIFRSLIFAEAHGGNQQCSLYNGVNRGGTPWTQFSFWERPNPIATSEKDPDEFLMYRLDYRKTQRGKKGEWCPYIALRRYCRHGKTEDHRRRTLARLEQLREVAAAALTSTQSSGKVTLVPGSSLSDYTGKFEEDLLVFFLDREHNVPTRLVQEIPEFHRELISNVPMEWTE